MGLSVAAVLCGTVAAMLMWKRPDWRRTQALLMFVVGLGLSGVAGPIRDRLMQLATSASLSMTQRVFGVGIPYAVALVIVLWFFFDMDLDSLGGRARGRGRGYNDHTTTAATPWLALLVPVSLAALPIISWLPEVLRGGVARLAGLLVG